MIPLVGIFYSFFSIQLNPFDISIINKYNRFMSYINLLRPTASGAIGGSFGAIFHTNETKMAPLV